MGTSDRVTETCHINGLTSYTRLFRRLMVTALTLTICAAQGCSSSLTKEHEQVCKQNKKIIIHDAELWREYRAQSEATHQRDVRAMPPIKWRTLYDPVGDFKIFYGEEKSYFRPNVQDKIIRNDIFVMKGKNVAGQIIDYVYQYRSIDGPTGFNCLQLYDDLIIGDADS